MHDTAVAKIYKILEENGEQNYSRFKETLGLAEPSDDAYIKKLVQKTLLSDDRFILKRDSLKLHPNAFQTAEDLLKNIAYTVVDIETTGSKPPSAGLMEVAAIKIIDG